MPRRHLFFASFCGNESKGTALNVSHRCTAQTAAMKGTMGQEEMHPNHTTPHISPAPSKPAFPGYYSLIPLVVLILIGCIVAVVKMFIYFCTAYFQNYVLHIYYNCTSVWLVLPFRLFISEEK